MNKLLASFALVLCVLPFYSSANNDTKQSVLPLEMFYQGERIERLRLSPNGKRLVALKNVKEDTLVQVIDLV
jgi:lipopolysaccharide export system protein LptC